MTGEATVAELGNELHLALADDEAFRRWYGRTFPRVFGYVASRTAGDAALAEEITQQAFIAAIEQRTRFDGRADTVTWLCTIARNKLVDHFRRQEREERRDQKVAIREVQMVGAVQAGHWTSPEDRELIAAAIRTLPPMQRAVLTFVALDGLAVPEVAQLIGKSAGATQSLLARARDGFRQAWEREIGHD